MMENSQRYNSFSHYLQQRYAGPVGKISVDAGFTCPNRDGRKGHGGCIFCRVDSFSKMESRQNISVAEQIERGLQAGRRRDVVGYIVYFQASTNTDAPLDRLYELFMKAISYPRVVGLAIATRPDCLNAGIVSLLSEVAGHTDLWIELGLQTIHEQTLQAINRGHTFNDFLNAVQALATVPARICGHLMLGLPGEDHEMMMQTAAAVAALPVHEIKLHPMLVLKDTPAARFYHAGAYKAMALQEYVDTAIDFMERLSPHMVIQRLTAEAPRDLLIAPLWSLHKAAVLQAIQQTFARRNTWQGRLFSCHY